MAWSSRSRVTHLHPETDFHEIYREITTIDFPWDMNQSLSLALFRTFAVPSIGGLLYATGEFTGQVQKRYDDTGILLDTILNDGFEGVEGRSALRRVNQMHRMYDISNDDMLYVLATFVVVPKRWLDDFGWRRLTPEELRASVNYFRNLGRHMGIRDIPETYTAFETLMDDYEDEHFAFDPGAKQVAEATLGLLSGFYPGMAKPLVDQFSLALMDQPLRTALGLPTPSDRMVRMARASLRARAKSLRLTPPRRTPVTAENFSRFQYYPNGYTISELGSHAPPVGCPHARLAPA